MRSPRFSFITLIVIWIIFAFNDDNQHDINKEFAWNALVTFEWFVATCLVVLFAITFMVEDYVRNYKTPRTDRREGTEESD